MTQLVELLFYEAKLFAKVVFALAGVDLLGDGALDLVVHALNGKLLCHDLQKLHDPFLAVEGLKEFLLSVARDNGGDQIICKADRLGDVGSVETKVLQKHGSVGSLIQGFAQCGGEGLVLDGGQHVFLDVGYVGRHCAAVDQNVVHLEAADGLEEK